MLFSKTCQNAILAMAYLAEQPPGELCPIREIGAATRIPAPFLGKIITALSRADLVSGRRGPRGGVTLNGAPDTIAIQDILEAVEGPPRGQRCLMGLPACNGERPCPLHDTWIRLREQLDRELHGLTLADLSGVRGGVMEP